MNTLIALMLTAVMGFSSFTSVIYNRRVESAMMNVTPSDLSDCVFLSSGEISNLEIGQLVGIIISENQTTPYRWEYALSNKTVLEWVHDEYRSDWNPRGMSGVGGSHTYYFRAVNAGECRIDLYDVRIGEDRDAFLQSISYEVIVTAGEYKTS